MAGWDADAQAGVDQALLGLAFWESLGKDDEMQQQLIATYGIQHLFACVAGLVSFLVIFNGDALPEMGLPYDQLRSASVNDIRAKLLRVASLGSTTKPES